MKVHRCAQRTEEWHQLRLGKLTGSRAADMLATIKSGEAAARRDLRVQLVCERLTGRPQESSYLNDEMRRGIDMEPAARAAYELLSGNAVFESGFIEHDSLLAGCSLDGHIGELTGLLSVKCPKSATHLRYLRAGEMPADYRPQMLHELWITGAHFYDFVSFDDRFPEDLQLFHVRAWRCDVIGGIEDYEKKALAFLAEIDREVEAVRTLRNLRGQLQQAATS